MKTIRTETRLGALVVSSCVLVSGGSLARARDLSFDERVAAQRAVEQVYWNHRTWPNENPTPKPPLDAVLPEAAIRAKVENGLRLSVELEERLRRPLTGEQVQAEIVRMVRETTAPETLRELFAALHDDPFLIAESLARPALVQRLVASARSEGERVLGERSGGTLEAGAVAPPAGGYTVPSLPVGGCTNDAWALSTLTAASGVNVPAARQLHTAVWTGAELIVWGGWDGSGAAFNTGGRYDPATDSWSLSSLTAGSGANVPSARFRHSAVWTGTEMIVWGGRDVAGSPLGNGGRFDVATDAWVLSTLTNASGANVPSARQLHTAVWTGTEMIVWGGSPGDASGALNTGGGYDPATDSWTLSTLTNASGSFTPVARIDHTAVWSGTEMIIWGGLNAAGSGLSNGGRYSPGTDSWAVSSLTNGTGSFVPAARSVHAAVWTGSEMIVWGGAPDATSAAWNNGGRFSPTTDAWVISSLTNATGLYVPTARRLPTAIWTGTEMIVWGGSTDGTSSALNNGGRYNPINDAWALSSLTNATGANVPSARQFHTAIWTGAADHRMIVWGGSPNTATGGLFCAACAPLLWYADGDGDGHGDPAVTQLNCTQPPGYVASGDDCDDADPAVHGGATETCNALDDDCDTIVDNGGGALCTDGDACTADLCDPAGACAATHLTVNLDVTGFSATRVDGRDLVVFALAWNSCPVDPLYNAAANLDQETTPLGSCIDASDFHLFMNAFGRSCP